MSSDFFADDELSQLREHGIVLFAAARDLRRPAADDGRTDRCGAGPCAGPIPSELRRAVAANGGRPHRLRPSPAHERQRGIRQLERAVLERQRRLPRPAGLDRPRAASRRRGRRRRATSPGTASSPPCPSAASSTATASTPWSSPARTTATSSRGSRACPRPGRTRCTRTALTTVAHDLHAAFAALHLDEDPLEPAGDYFTGQTLLEYLDERHQDARPVARADGQAGRLLPPRHGRLAKRRSPTARWARTARSRASRCATRSRPTTRRWSNGWRPPAWRSTGRCKAARSPPTWR